MNMKLETSLSVSYPRPEVAVVEFDTPGRSVNLLTREALEELAAILEELQRRPEVAGIVIASRKPGVFVAGADVTRLEQNTRRTSDEIAAASQRGQAVFSRLAEGEKVTVAAIDGPCLGGGAELACWCDGRIAAAGAKTEIGFPEVKLGLIPGWGGSALLPRLVGLGNAVELITGGRALSCDDALRIGLLDDVVPRERLLDAALDWLDRQRHSGEFQTRRQQRRGPLGIAAAELDFLRQNAANELRRRPTGEREAAFAALDTMVAAANEDRAAACRRESLAVAARFADPAAAGLIHVFVMTDAQQREAAAASQAAPPIETVGILGAGIMGSGIAGANLKKGVRVVIDDERSAALTAGIERAIAEAAYDRRLKGIDPQRALKLAAQIAPATGVDAFADCQLVIEAVVENEEVKRQMLARLDEQLPPETFLASNTSTFPITDLARDLKHPRRFCGLHFFNPVRILKLVEVIRGAATGDDTIAAAVAYARRLGKIPVVVNDGPGFLANRLLFPYMNEGLALLHEGATLDEIDGAAVAYGMAMGPCGVFDLVGMDTALFAGQTLWKAFPDRVFVSPLVPAFLRAGRLGRKSGGGFFAYPDASHEPRPDAESKRLIESYVRTRRTFTAKEIQTRLLLPMLFEAIRVLEDGIVRQPRDVDLGVVHGLGFPAHRGGLLFWADTVGAARLVEIAKPLEPLGLRFQPPRTLVEMARAGRGFFST